MKKFSRNNSVAGELVDNANPLWVITAMLAIFFGAGAILIAWG